MNNLDINRLVKYFNISKKGNIIKRILEEKYFQSLSKYLKNRQSPFSCQALKSSCFINPNGEVYPCTIYDVPLGNLRKYAYNINNLWRSGLSLKTREAIDHNACPKCWSPCEAYPAILGNLFCLVRKI